MPDTSPPPVNEITGRIIGSAIRVHRTLGPGLLESAYRACLSYEVKRTGLAIAVESPVPLMYGDVQLECGYRVDLVVENLVIVEVKAAKEILAIHVAQVLTYLKLTGCPIALLLNFNVERLVDGIHRLVNPRFTNPVAAVPRD